MENTSANVNLKEKIESHFEELFLIYAVVFLITGILSLFIPERYEKWKYLVIGVVFFFGLFLLRVNRRRKEKKEAIKQQELEKLAKAKIWEFLSLLPPEEQIAFKHQYEIAKLRGLWSKEELDKEIKKYFIASSKVKIKVTRGYNLFFDDGHQTERDIFYHCINEAGKDQKREIELLLHYPCLQNEHTKARAIANKITVSEYVKTLFKVIKTIKDVTNSTVNKNEIAVRFYNDYEIKWRYYLFEDSISKKKTLFLNYYDAKKSGADSPMLKIEYGEGTLCQDFDTKFDEIFSNDKASKEIVTNIKTEKSLISSRFCTHKECAMKIKEFYCEIFETSLPTTTKPMKTANQSKKNNNRKR